MEVVLAVAVLLAYVSVVEYVAHRWFMHRRGASHYHPHHVMHHGHGDNSDEYMDFSLWTAARFFLASAPLSIGLTWLLWPYAGAAFIVLCGWWYFAWKSTHRLIHDDRRYWWARVVVPYYHAVLKHHEGHHVRPTRNFGALFFWSDYVFGTKVK